MDELEKNYAGLKTTFKKLKERKRLTISELTPLQQFVDATVSCTTNTAELKKIFRPEHNNSASQTDKLTALRQSNSINSNGQENCNRECDPVKCDNCAWMYAELVRQRVIAVNTHHHTKTCVKKRPGCRFGIPRPPSEFTIIAQAMPEEVKKVEEKTVDSLEYIMGKVKTELKRIEDDLIERQREDVHASIDGSLSTMLSRLFLDIRISDDESELVINEDDAEYTLKASLVKEAWSQNPRHSLFPVNLQSPREILRSAVYHYALSVCKSGTKVVIKRELQDIFVNNFNAHWMLAWDGNMDIQPCFDYFSVITYMTDYVCKPETKTTEVLKHVNKTKKNENVPNKDLMYALGQAYLSSREMGECEAYYKLDPNLHFKQSNVKTIFIASGFPQNRAKFLRKCSSDVDVARGISVDGHDGKFLESESHHSKYAMRPLCMERICLCQHCMRYSQITALEANKIRRTGRRPAPPPSGKGWEGILHIVTDDVMNTSPLPDFIELDNGKVMKLRKFDAVVRRHKFKEEKEAHEFFFSELLLFWPWRNESELFPDDPKKCAELYHRVKPSIDHVKKTLFPHLDDVELGREMVENFEFDMNEIGAAIDPEGEQGENPDTLAELAAEYGGLDPEGFDSNPNQSHSNDSPIPFFRAPPVLDMDTLVERTRKLVWEQMVVLQLVIRYCRDLVLFRLSATSNKLTSGFMPSFSKSLEPPLLIIHGGAGTGKSMLINLTTLWVQKILVNSGDDPCSPYMVLAAPTGMAASNIEGQTLHTAFKFTFGNEYKSLSDKNRDLQRDFFKNVEVIIIDEFSMMKSCQLYHLHMRLCEVKQTDKLMGGLCVLMFGRFNLTFVQNSIDFITFIFRRPHAVEAYKRGLHL